MFLYNNSDCVSIVLSIWKENEAGQSFSLVGSRTNIEAS